MNKNDYLTVEEVISLPTFSSLNIREDGQSLAFVKKTTDWKENKYREHVWIYEKNKTTSHPITTGDTESSSPQWSPDSTTLAYLAKVGKDDHKKNQILVKPAEGYTGIPITNEEEGVSSFKWAPDGKGIYYISKNPESKEIKNRKEIYGDYIHVDKEYTKNSLYYINVEKGIEKIEKAIIVPGDIKDNNIEEHGDCRNKEENDLKTPKNFGEKLIDIEGFFIQGFDISPNNKKIAFTTTPTPDMKEWGNVAIHIFDIKSKEVKSLNIDAMIESYQVIFSPDSTKVCYARSKREKSHYDYNIDDNFLQICNIETGETTSPLTGVDIEASLIRWTEKGIMITWQEETNYLVGLLLEDGRIDILTERDESFAWHPSITKDGEHVAYIKACPKETFEIYLDSEKITNENKLFDNKLISKKDVVSWKSSDGLDIEGVLSLPSDFDSSRKYPLLVVIHGGPTWASFPIPAFNKYYPIDQFVEKGFLVLEPNYRGSSGYGEAFKKANFRKLGLGDYDDVISGVDMLIDKGMVDKDKLGVMGWSQGGYISAFCSTYSDRFKAISVGAGISNWITYYVNTDILLFTRRYLGNTPWEDKEIYEETSPMTYIKGACTPTLIQHGEKDTRVPTPNAYELYHGLQDMGVESELVIFNGMGHVSEKPGFNRAIMKQNLMWFSHYILDETMDGFKSL